MAQHKFGLSLNDNDPEERIWLDEIAKSGMIPSQVFKDALRAYFGTTREEQQRATNNDVVQAIYELRDTFVREIANIQIVYPLTDAPRQELPPTMDETPTTWEEIDPNADTPFLAGVRKMGARPGMRLEKQ
jgi:hypothetical protein